MSDTTQTPVPAFDPTESTRTLTSDLYTEEKMTLREHQDIDKHYIGDSLPVPSDVQVSSSGINKSAGKLPFPARVDHTHDQKTCYGIYTASNTIAPGQTFINTWSHTGWGKNILLSGQMIGFPYPGIWRYEANFYITRDGGGNFTNEMNVIAYYHNGTYSRIILRQSNFDLPTLIVVTVSDVVAFATAPDANSNVQLAIQHNDPANWTASIQTMVVYRIGSIDSL